MLKFYKPISVFNSSNLNVSNSNVNSNAQQEVPLPTPAPPPISPYIEVNLKELVADPGLRRSIYDYDVNDREKVRRAYLQRGSCQPRNHSFPLRKDMNRAFVLGWYKEYTWLEYSIHKDVTYCLVCYLFKPKVSHTGGGGAFVNEGFGNWRKKSRLNVHVGDHNSVHNQCLKACNDLLFQGQHIKVCLSSQSDQVRTNYRIRLNAFVDCIRFLLRQGLAFRGHDESENQGNFLANHCEEINKVVLKNTPENLKLTSPIIQKEIVSVIATETTTAIIREVGDNLFPILVDKAQDISVKEQMVVVLRYVDDRVFIMERFLGIVHVSDTSALSLKKATESLFSYHGLSISSIRGQGYDGANNMRGEFKGLKALFLKENYGAHYVHCFAHQLQLTLVAVAKIHSKIGTFFYMVSLVSNVVGVSCKRRDILQEKQAEHVIKKIGNGELLIVRGLNKETTLKRPGDTRWGSHFGTIVSFVNLFSCNVDVLLVIGEIGGVEVQRRQADDLCERIQTFQFSFCLHLMRMVLGITNDLSQALQRKDQDIVNAINSKHGT